MKTSYSPVVAQLFTLGDPYERAYEERNALDTTITNEEYPEIIGETHTTNIDDLPLPVKVVWPDYRALGLSEENIPELTALAIDMRIYMETDGEETEAGDDELEAEQRNRAFGVIHAWHALGQLKAESAAVALLSLLLVLSRLDDDYGITELPKVLGKMGEISLQLVDDGLENNGIHPEGRTDCVNVVTEVHKVYPELRGQCIELLAAELERKIPDRMHNGFVVFALIEMEATEVLDIIRNAYHWDRVALSVCGDIEEVEIAMGVRTERSTPARQWFEEEERRLKTISDLVEMTEAGNTRQVIAEPKIGRNEPCPCGSGKKYKKCCGK